MKGKPRARVGSVRHAFSADDVRRILLEHRFLMKADALCKKWEISRAHLRDLKKAGGFDALAPSLRELVIAALASSPAGTHASLASLAAWVDYQNHCPVSEDEIRAAVGALVSDGVAAWSDDGRVRFAPSDARLAARFVF